MRGEFRFADGLVVHNNITSAGHAMILAAAFRNVVPVSTFAVILCDGVYTPTMIRADLTEVGPTNGYVAKYLSRNEVDWTAGALNGEQFVESKDLVWQAAGGNFDHAFSRMALLDNTSLAVYALSGSLPAPRLITPATPSEQRTLRYRIYLGQ